MSLTITGGSVRDGGLLRARLTYSGRLNKVVLLTAPDGRRLGRITPAGFFTGEWDPGSPGCLYEPWTAKHPTIHTPSDTPTGQPMPWEQCVAFIVGGSS